MHPVSIREREKLSSNCSYGSGTASDLHFVLHLFRERECISSVIKASLQRERIASLQSLFYVFRYVLRISRERERRRAYQHSRKRLLKAKLNPPH
jgi:hypothetical protein